MKFNLEKGTFVYRKIVTYGSNLKKKNQEHHKIHYAKGEVIQTNPLKEGEYPDHHIRTYQIRWYWNYFQASHVEEAAERHTFTLRQSFIDWLLDRYHVR